MSESATKTLQFPAAPKPRRKSVIKIIFFFLTVSIIASFHVNHQNLTAINDSHKKHARWYSAEIQPKIDEDKTKKKIQDFQTKPDLEYLFLYRSKTTADVRRELYSKWDKNNKHTNIHCEKMRNKSNEEFSNTSRTKRPLFGYDFNCQEAFGRHPGTGNWIYHFYQVRLTAKVLGIDVSMKCSKPKPDTLVLSWMMGWFPYSTNGEQVSMHHSLSGFPSVNETCQQPEPHISYLLEDIRYDFRRLAIAHLGIVPSPLHPSAQWSKANGIMDNQGTHRHHNHSGWHQIPVPEQPYYPNEKVDDVATHRHHNHSGLHQIPVPEQPYYPNEKVDDVAIHFRCGDSLRNGHKAMGYLKYQAYASRISPEARTIGILTQPFNRSEFERGVDRDEEGKGRCRLLVTGLVEYLEERFPKATISIHNSVDETISLTFARMVMANQSFAHTSTFSVPAVLATFGTGYFVAGHFKGPLGDNHHLMDEPFLNSVSLATLWNKGGAGADAVVEWFKNDTLLYNAFLTPDEIELIVNGRASELVFKSDKYPGELPSE